MGDVKGFSGIERASLLFGEDDMPRRMTRWEQMVDKHWGEVMNTFTYRGLDARNILEPKVQQLCAIAALTMINAVAPLKTHIKCAFRAGATDAEIKEAILQTTRYCGLPFVNSAFVVYEDVARERGTSNEAKQ
ncbi:carboxymuconolactone decarboxylase family protein [Chloroflexota bacterium]